MNEKITYKDAGVDVELADRVIGSLADRIKSTFRPEVMGKMGGFAAMFRPQWSGHRDPVLVSATDGVGTKLKIAFLTGIHDTVGIDLVAMNVNDLLVMGAEPLFFLDYFATGSIEAETVRAVISGIVRGCELAGCSLIGGETAEMPDFYAPGEYDLAGFCVGMVDHPDVVDGSKIKTGDTVLGSGLVGPSQQRIQPGQESSSGTQEISPGNYICRAGKVAWRGAAHPNCHLRQTGSRVVQDCSCFGNGPHHRRRIRRQYSTGPARGVCRRNNQKLLGSSPNFRSNSERRLSGRFRDVPNLQHGCRVCGDCKS